MAPERSLVVHAMVWVALAVAAAPVAAQSAASPSATAAVDGDRIARAGSAEPGSWLSHGRTYDEQRFSPLARINRDNVAKLGLAWSYDTGLDRGHEATPLVADGVMYLTTSWSTVHAIDLRTGRSKWIFDPQVPRQWGRNACCDVVNRGVALWQGNVFAGTIDGRLIKLDAGTGEVAWDISTIDRAKPYTITGAPRVVKGRVIIGNGGAEYGVRGYVSAYDAGSGALVWRFYTVPGDPSKPFEHQELEMAARTWSGEWWRAGGGGTVWDSMAFDPELDLLYVGTGNGSPWARRDRSPGGGDNLFLSSILALDPDDGKLAWYYQTTPADNWDYTAVQHIMLADLTIDGQPRQVVMQAPKNGFFYVLDRKTGELISAEAYTRVTWASHVDRASGRPVETEQANFDAEPKAIYPGPLGGHNWQPMAFHPGTGLVYIPTRDQGMVYQHEDAWSYDPRVWNLAIRWDDPRARALSEAGLDTPAGALKAWDPVAQREVWSVPHKATNNGGLLATAGDLVFQGDPSGRFTAYSAREGELLWSTDTRVGIVAAPITYELDGEQYVAVLAGWGGAVAGSDAAVSAAVKNTNPGRLFSFKLGGTAKMPEVAPRYSRVAPPPAPFGTREEIARGWDLYDQHCATCHGFGGASSGLVSDLRYSNEAAHANFDAIVRQGRFVERGMPSFGDVLEARQVREIHAFVVDLAQKRPAPDALQAPPPDTTRLGAITRAAAEQALAGHGFTFADGRERGRLPARTAAAGSAVAELIGPAERPRRFTLSWSGTAAELAASLDRGPALLAPFAPFAGQNFFLALERYGQMSVEKDGVHVVGVLREGGDRRLWFVEAVAGER